MKELNIEEKAKAYDEALERYKAKQEYESQEVHEFIEYLFPELKEDNDERIRKTLIAVVNLYYGEGEDEEKTACLNWLEKQAQKPVFEIKTPEESLGIDSDTYNKIVDECIYGEQNPADKVEPKFKISDWVVYEENIYQIHNISLKKYYECLRTDGTMHTFDFEYIDSKSHLWNIQDAKDGDVLATDNGVCIFDGTLEEGKYPFAYCGLTKQRGFESYNENLPFSHDNNIHPATKEQRDTLFVKMKEAGYEWDAEKKELKKIKDKPLVIDEGKAEMDRNFTEMVLKDYTKAPEKLHLLPNGLISYCRTNDDDIEYIRKDAFIEKACEWLRTHSEDDYFELIPDANYCGAGTLNKKRMVEDFRKYIKGE